MLTDQSEQQTLVRDVEGYVYPLGAQIGRGGQGVVHESVHGWMAVKRFLPTARRSSVDLQHRIAAVRRLPLENLAIARPLAVLAPPDSGYVMRLLTGMEPVRRLIRPSTHETSVREWYRDSGGLRRRLRLLARLAAVFAELHALGLTYGDPSPSNLLVSAEIAANEVRLIDADNVRVAAPSSGSSIYTPGYGAPEVVQGRSGNSFASDVWAFAVVAFEVLALHHPFIGADVEEGEPDREEAANRGELPWIDDVDEAGNRAAPTSGLPRKVVLSPALRRLFQQCFGPGRLTPEARPSAADFATALLSAARMTLGCSACTGSVSATYYVTFQECPWCGKRRPPVALAQVGRWDPFAELPAAGALGLPRRQVLEVGQEYFVSMEQRSHMGTVHSAERCLRVVVTQAGVSVRAVNGRGFEVRSPDGLDVRAMPPEGVMLPSPTIDEGSWRVHTGSLDSAHSYVRFVGLEGGHGRR